MANFITRMVERAYGLTEVVQPLTTPLFADESSPKEDTSVSLGHERENPDVTKKVGSAPFFPPRPRPEKAKAVEEASITQKSTQPPIATVIKETNGVESRMTVKNNVFPKRDENNYPLSQQIKVEEHSHNSTIPSDIDVIPAKVKSPGFTTQAEESRISGVKPSQRVAEENEISESPTLVKNWRDVEGEGHSLAVKGYLRSERAGLANEQLPSTSESRSPQGKQPLAPPAIKVTIGRIDVRAIMQKSEPTPVRRVVQRKPGLSLEEYLRQRSGGER